MRGFDRLANAIGCFAKLRNIINNKNITDHEKTIKPLDTYAPPLLP